MDFTLGFFRTIYKLRSRDLNLTIDKLLMNYFELRHRDMLPIRSLFRLSRLPIGNRTIETHSILDSQIFAKLCDRFFLLAFLDLFLVRE